jgi:hypothetical protein
MAALLTIAGLMGSIALFEGVAALLEHLEGDPEADVELALKQLAAKNQRRAFATMATEQRGAEHLQEKFAKFNRIPSRLLTQAALSRMPQPEVGGGGNTAVLDMISQRLGISPRTLNQVSSPSRMGDMSSIARQMGTSPQTSGQ